MEELMEKIINDSGIKIISGLMFQDSLLGIELTILQGIEKYKDYLTNQQYLYLEEIFEK